MTYWIVTTNAKRGRFWQRVFGSSRLPVITDGPRLQCLIPGQPEVRAYDLNANALHPLQIRRFAGEITRQTYGRISYNDAIYAIERGYPIVAEDTELVRTADPSRLARLLFKARNFSQAANQFA